MKKKTLGLIGLCVLASAGLGTCVGMTVYNYYDNQANVIMVKAEELDEETTSSEITPEEENKIKELLAELAAKYKEIRDAQIFGTTIGAIIGTIVGAVVSMIPALLNRSNIKKALEEVALTRGIVDSNKKLAEQLKKDYQITNQNYDKAIKVMDDMSKTLAVTQAALGQLSKENAEIKAENKEIKELLLAVFSQSTVLTSLGISEEAFKKFLPEHKE